MITKPIKSSSGNHRKKNTFFINQYLKRWVRQLPKNILQALIIFKIATGNGRNGTDSGEIAIKCLAEIRTKK
jgi:hypothetical protein